MNNGAGGWKAAGEKTWWPKGWSNSKVWSKISEAYGNKAQFKGNKWGGTAADGNKIEMYIDENGNISTAYPVHQFQ